MGEQPSRMRAHWRFAAAIVALAAIWLAMLLRGAGRVDRAIYEDLYASHRPAILTSARIFTFSGEPTLLIGASALVALLLWRAGRGRTGLVLVAVAMSGRGLSEVQKYWVARPRPG